MSSMRHIEVVPYDDSWPEQAERWKAVLAELLGDELIRTEHIGSTSVPGLAAKPVIDLMPLVRDISCLDCLRPTFELAGFTWYGEYGLPGRRYVNNDDPETNLRLCNVHMYAIDDPDVDRHLAFPAYLRNWPDLRDQYAALKQECALKFPSNIAGYMDCKNDWIQQVQIDAEAWWKATKS
jgi:GrpB-like predicted nucleotidyltransferase (UPF0157 family)